MMIMEIFTGCRQGYVPLRGRLHLSKICLGSALLAGNSYLLLISPKYSKAEERPYFKPIIAVPNLTAIEKQK